MATTPVNPELINEQISHKLTQQSLQTVEMRLNSMLGMLVETLGPKAGVLGNKTKSDTNPTILALKVSNLVHRLCSEYEYAKQFEKERFDK